MSVRGTGCAQCAGEKGGGCFELECSCVRQVQAYLAAPDETARSLLFFLGQAVDRAVAVLAAPVERSSLGTDEARAMRASASAPRETVDATLARILDLDVESR